MLENKKGYKQYHLDTVYYIGPKVSRYYQSKTLKFQIQHSKASGPPNKESKWLHKNRKVTGDSESDSHLPVLGIE